MKIISVVFIVVRLLLAPAEGWAGAENQLWIEVFPKIIKQGDVFLVRASGPKSIQAIHGEFRGKKFTMASGANKGSYEGLVGIDLDGKPARYEMKVLATGEDSEGYSKALSLTVEKTDFAVQKLSLPRSMVDLDPKTLERVNQESKRLKALFQGIRKEKFWKGPFIRPLEGELSGAFGVRRIINGQAKNPHSGIDLRADEGTPVAACNSGLVALVDELFFSGKSVILDHGGGLYSMYFHLSETRVSEGNRVSKSHLLGRVGSTGRSTAPHLHWGMILRGSRVDPLSFLRLTEHLQ